MESAASTSTSGPGSRIQEQQLDNVPVDVEASREQPSSSSGTEDTSPSLSQRAALGFSALLKRLRRQASHVRVPSSEEGAASTGETPAIAVLSEEGASSSGRQALSPNGGSPRLGRAGSGHSGSGKERVCLICLDALSDEEFRRGEAISLECGCRGDLALRHKACAVKWVQVKGDNICELCKQPVRNLPAPPPRPPSEAGGAEEYYDPQLMEFSPTSADLVFDCVRVTWVAMIVSILFFEMSLGAALWTGIVAGLAYSVMVRVLYHRHWAQIRALQQQQQQLHQQHQELHQQQQPAPAVVTAV